LIIRPLKTIQITEKKTKYFFFQNSLLARFLKIMKLVAWLGGFVDSLYLKSIEGIKGSI
jgi:hypothetical protein